MLSLTLDGSTQTICALRTRTRPDLCANVLVHAVMCICGRSTRFAWPWTRYSQTPSRAVSQKPSTVRCDWYERGMKWLCECVCVVWRESDWVSWMRWWCGGMEHGGVVNGNWNALCGMCLNVCEDVPRWWHKHMEVFARKRKTGTSRIQNCTQRGENVEERYMYKILYYIRPIGDTCDVAQMGWYVFRLLWFTSQDCNKKHACGCTQAHIKMIKWTVQMGIVRPHIARWGICGMLLSRTACWPAFMRLHWVNYIKTFSCMTKVHIFFINT